jgi:hypothetical protein
VDGRNAKSLMGQSIVFLLCWSGKESEKKADTIESTPVNAKCPHLTLTEPRTILLLLVVECEESEDASHR